MNNKFNFDGATITVNPGHEFTELAEIRETGLDALMSFPGADIFKRFRKSTQTVCYVTAKQKQWDNDMNMEDEFIYTIAARGVPNENN